MLAVDNKFISRGMFGDPSTAITKVDPGPREIVVTVRFNKGLGTGPFETMVPMDVDLKPATEYQLKGAVEGATVKTWLEFALTGEKASNTYTATYGKSARQPAPIPVFIPAR